MPPGTAAAFVYPTLEALLSAVRSCRACEFERQLVPVLRARIKVLAERRSRHRAAAVEVPPRQVAVSAPGPSPP